MKSFLKVIAYLKPYTGLAGLNILFNVLFTVFSLFSLVILIPFLDTIFDTGATIESHLSAVRPAFELTKDALLGNLNYFIGQIIGDVDKSTQLFRLCIIIVSIFLLKNMCRYFAMFFLAPIRNNVIRDLRSDIYNKILILPLSYYSNERQGDLLSRMTIDVQEVEHGVVSTLEVLFRDVLTIMVSLTVMIMFSAELTMFVFFVLPISGVLISFLAKSLRRTANKGQKEMGNLMSIFQESVAGLRIIKAFVAGDFSRAKFGSSNDQYAQFMTKALRKKDFSSPLTEFLGIGTLSVVLWYGGGIVLKGGDDVLRASEFIAYIAIFSQIIPPAKTLTGAFFRIVKGMSSLDRINEILDIEIKIDENKEGVSIKEFNSKIEYNNISFAYDKETVLEDVSFEISKGKTIALVGPSGGGKSTLADLLPRFHDVQSGEIKVDGVALQDYSLKDLRRLIGVVTQESILFNDSIFNNIAFGINNPNKEKVIEAAKIANAHDFIMEMEDGYNSNIGDRGNKLSGGQRQRMSIARAIMKNPPILVLDEATSALDSESEKLVQDALHKLMKNRTSLVIAHRLSTIQNADEILVIKDGNVEERGSHDDLLKNEGHYKKMFDLQTFE
ncbi:MAG: ABC transporter ATP-binding protein [Flavobacteriales bacterium]|nr:ABC transporter ATP-binding protein [Flavobacteriales bacterium]